MQEKQERPGLLEEPTDDDGTDEVAQDQDQDQEQQQGQTEQQQQQQQGQGGGQTGYTDETVKAIQDALEAAGFGETIGSGNHTIDTPNNPNHSGPGINWG